MATLSLIGGAFVVGAVFFYFFLRANPKKAKTINRVVNTATR